MADCSQELLATRFATPYIVRTMSMTDHRYTDKRAQGININLGIFFLSLFLLFGGFAWAGGQQEAEGMESSEGSVASERGGSRERGTVEVPQGHERIVLAGGCFWCMEPPYDELDGVHAITTGFAGGHVENPTYRQAVGGGTGHHEVVEVIYDPEAVAVRELLEVYWVNIDPVDEGGQFCDRGSVYETGIFYTTDEQREMAEQTRAAVEAADILDRGIVTEIRELEAFYPAEEEHQAYYRKNPTRYRFYVGGCGRENRLNELWGPLRENGGEMGEPTPFETL